MNNVDLIRHIYDRFTEGDAEAVLARFDDDVEFRLAEGHPYQPSGQPWIGKESIASNFFMQAGPEWERWTIQVRSIVETEDGVLVEGRYRGTYKPTGNVMDLQVCHVWAVKDGKVSSFHQYVDTAGLQEVMESRVPQNRRRVHA